MELLERLVALVGGDRPELETEARARRIRLALVATLATAAAAAVFGLAAGVGQFSLAVSNVFSVPMVVLFSGVAALPGGALAVKLTGAELGGTDLLMSLVAAIFTGALVLGASAPVVGLYYLTESTLSGHIGMAAAIVAEVVAIWVFFRAAMTRRAEGVRRRDILVPVTVVAVIQVVCVVQLVGIASPILPETTPFTAGMEGLVAR